MLPTFLSPSVLLTWLKGDDGNYGASRIKTLAIRLLESPIGQSFPELNTLAFLFGGQFLELGRRVVGLSYVSVWVTSRANLQVSTTPSRSHEKRSYQPLGVLLCLPLIIRLILGYRTRGRAPPGVADVIPSQEDTDETQVSGFDVSDASSSDRPNTYLSREAQEIDERQCTLCLEPRGSGQGSAGTVAVTECGHAFCWGCLGGLDKVSSNC